VNLLSGGQYAVLARDVADATFAAVQETLAPASQRDLRLVSNSSPAAGLQLIAEETGASIIVVGSSHRSRLDRVLSGSVTESVLSGAPVPVAVAPRHYSGTDRARLDRLVLRLDHALDDVDDVRLLERRLQIGLFGRRTRASRARRRRAP